MPDFQGYLNAYGYPTLFILILIEGCGIPAPGQACLIAAAFLAAHGQLQIALVVVTAILAAAIGNSVGYWIGTRRGRALVLRYGRYVGISEPEMQRMESLFTRYGMWFVSFARFFEVLRQLNGIVAGTAAMPLRRFQIANVLGATLWAGVWGLGSWKLGQQIQDYEDLTEKTGIIFVVLLIATLAVFLGLFLRRHWKNHRGP